MNGYMMKIK
ncbi:hypothetical protein PENSTE_c026G00733 [Penicillium steckii]|uniref:Uncharacterized protein n=1 Tax=Penicillium steckii TaxID=303698 RepID=A0A1V6SP90_9EURO|nr:hypothetical protein PENSTE_c026G00733 [Penicillium steckii]